ncbi:Crp/Fnr family transcriptional regulator [Sphingomonas aliaeris]|uniref:Crp/Fnr family transcriptional regulator n=1 Tax=Sphingomonas aliaeris TaxID=2759526 RepID=A0A974NTT1_9SPHN|nr:Crp/Fnr family transcriptional regulator [Sphingomonas aliaeris]QQV76643.1 Crp/Fnr family transcriptional regulator [Sphingomonas aliaeris]
MQIDAKMLDRDPWFGAIPPERRTALLAEGRVRAVTTGGSVYGIGDPPNGLWCVLEGQVRLKGYSANGVEMLVLVLRPGKWFGELSTLDGGPRPHDALAFGDTRLLHIAMPAFGRAVDLQPMLYRDLGLLVCAHQRSALDFLGQSVSQSVRVRLASSLAHSTIGADGYLQVRQDELAALVGVSRQSVNRHLRLFEQAGLIALGYREIRVRDAAGLLAIAAE